MRVVKNSVRGTALEAGAKTLDRILKDKIESLYRKGITEKSQPRLDDISSEIAALELEREKIIWS